MFFKTSIENILREQSDFIPKEKINSEILLNLSVEEINELYDNLFKLIKSGREMNLSKILESH